MHSKCNTDPRVGTSNDHFYGTANLNHLDKVLVLPKGLICLEILQPDHRRS
jgi:hypothetical protein